MEILPGIIRVFLKCKFLYSAIFWFNNPSLKYIYWQNTRLRLRKRYLKKLQGLPEQFRKNSFTSSYRTDQWLLFLCFYITCHQYIDLICTSYCHQIETSQLSWSSHHLTLFHGVKNENETKRFFFDRKIKKNDNFVDTFVFLCLQNIFFSENVLFLQKSCLILWYCK